MSNKKYSGEFKCAVVRYYLETHNGSVTTARHFSINPSQVKAWLRLFRSQGYAGLLKRQPTIHRTLAFKRLVVATLIKESLSYLQASVLFEDIAPSTILQWKRLYDRGLLEGSEEALTMTKKAYRPDRKKPDTEKTQEELLRELQYMRAEVAFLKKWNELEAQGQRKQSVTDRNKKQPK